MSVRSGCVFPWLPPWEAALVRHVLSAGSMCLSRQPSPLSFPFWSVTVPFPHPFRSRYSNTSSTATSLKLLHYVLWFPYTLPSPLTYLYKQSLCSLLPLQGARVWPLVQEVPHATQRGQNNENKNSRFVNKYSWNHPNLVCHLFPARNWQRSRNKSFFKKDFIFF